MHENYAALDSLKPNRAGCYILYSNQLLLANKEPLCGLDAVEGQHRPAPAAGPGL